MSEEPAKTYVVFHSTLFSFDWPEEDPDLAPPWGNDCAAFIGKRLQEFEEIARVDDEPYQVESGWIIDVVVGRERYTLFVHWVPMDEPPVNAWAIQVQPQQRILDWFFRRPLRHLDDLLKIIAQILESTEGISDAQWMDFDEFSKVY